MNLRQLTPFAILIVSLVICTVLASKNKYSQEANSFGKTFDGLDKDKSEDPQLYRVQKINLFYNTALEVCNAMCV